MINNALIKNIKQYRLQTKPRVTQKALAEHLGIDRTTYSKIESGDIGISSEKVSLIASKLGVTVADLYGEETRTKSLRDILSDIDDMTDDDGNPLSQSVKDDLKSKIYELLAKK